MKSGAFLSFSLIGFSPSQLFAQAGKEDCASRVSPPEDLMREHGILRRILLIYEESVRRIEAGEELPLESLAEASRITRSFVENYHEVLEEDFLFPRFKKAGRLTDLVDVLIQQHNAGRRLTDATMRLADSRTLKSPGDRLRLSASLKQYVSMYRPHAAREDSVLFPALRGVVSPKEFDALGERFERREEDLFGYTGFFRIADQVAEIEKRLGILDLSRFTPPAAGPA